MCREWKRRLAGLLVVVIMATSIDPFALYGWRDAYGAISEIDESVGDASSSDADEIELWDDLATSGDAEIEEILLEEDNEALMAPGIPVMTAHGTKSITFNGRHLWIMIGWPDMIFTGMGNSSHPCGEK